MNHAFTKRRRGNYRSYLGAEEHKTSRREVAMTANQNQYFANQEIGRHNRVMENLTSQQNAETQRANLAKEKENFRSHLASEINTQDYNEFSRIHWSNSDAEARRHDLNTEEIARQENTNKFVTDAEKNALSAVTNLETKRANKAREQQNANQLWAQLLGTLGGAYIRSKGGRK